MKRTKTIMLAAATVAAAIAHAQPAEPVIYPAKGQTAAQQDKDRGECAQWARQQSGYDPSAATAQAPAASEASGTAVQKPPSLPALPEPPGLPPPPRPPQIQEPPFNGAAAQAGTQGRAQMTWMRALAACMEGRGYTVK
jgi:hypothetical protein